jgi:hypothetical protein
MLQAVVPELSREVCDTVLLLLLLLQFSLAGRMLSIAKLHSL